MLSVTLGPLALPVLPLVLLVAIWVSSAVSRHMAPGNFGPQAENMVWIAAGLGLLASRMAHVLPNAQVYLATPWAVVDIRDGGWFSAAGWAVAALWLAWRGWRQPVVRPALGGAALAAGMIWSAGLLMVWSAEAKSAGQPAPDVMLTELTGTRTLGLPHIIKGRPSVVNLWATWCGPCRAEMPTLAAAQKNTPDVSFVFVNQGESQAKVTTYLQRTGLMLNQVWLDPASRLGPASGSEGLPTTLFFDANGNRVDAHFGMLNAAALQVKLNHLQHQ